MQNYVIDMVSSEGPS